MKVAVQRIIASYHTTPKEAGMVFVQAKPKLAVYTHFVLLSNATIPPPTLDEVIAATRQTYSGPLEAGEDLTSFEIGDTVTVHHFKPCRAFCARYRTLPLSRSIRRGAPGMSPAQ